MIEECRRFLQAREDLRQAQLQKRFDRAWQEAAAIIGMLIRTYRPARIYQWGSLLDRSRFWERSDIDIAVEGVGSAEEFFAMYRDADRMASLPLDLIALERIEPEFADIIRSRGKLVYDREGEGSDASE